MIEAIEGSSASFGCVDVAIDIRLWSLSTHGGSESDVSLQPQAGSFFDEPYGTIRLIRCRDLLRRV